MSRFCLCVGVLAAFLMSGGTTSSLAASKTIPVISLRGTITEKPVGDDFPFGPLNTESFQELIARINKAADDRRIEAVVLLLEGASLGEGQLEELHRAILRLREQGKKVYAHADHLTTGGYALLAGADRLSMTPTGYLFITGLYGEQVYVRGLLDRLGVQPDFVTCGEYKSAAEMFMRTGPSEQAAEMYRWLFDGLYEGVLEMIATGRKVDVAQARKWIDTGLYSAEKAQAEGLIDAVEYRRDFVAHVEAQHGPAVVFDKKYGRKQRPTVDLNNPFAVMELYLQLLTGPKTTRSTKDAVGVVYVEGSILPGSPEPSPFSMGEGAYSDPIRKALDSAAEDDTIKAVVLRVDSPGGSAVASEVILEACRRVAQKKPLVVSMGNVAASGGYYVTLASNIVYADANTITGSIGVVGGKLATTGMWSKIGITFNPISRGARASMLSSASVFTDEERDHFQSWMNEVYAAFKQHVTDIRGDKLRKPLEELAGGRVFTGRQARELGLVDELGGIDDAIRRAAREANLPQYEIRVIPPPRNFLELLLADISGETDEDKQRLAVPPVSSGGSLWEAVLPWLDGLDGERLRIVRQAFQQLELFREEQVLMTAPLFQVRLP